MAKCDWDDVIWELAWEHFKSALYRKVLKKAGKRAALALLAALADSPVPGPGDLLGILILLFTVLEGFWDLSKLIDEFNALRATWREVVARELRRRSEIFGENFLDNDCACECLKQYIRDLAAASKALNKRTRMRKRRKALDDFDNCLLECFS